MSSGGRLGDLLGSMKLDSRSSMHAIDFLDVDDSTAATALPSSNVLPPAEAKTESGEESESSGLRDLLEVEREARLALVAEVALLSAEAARLSSERVSLVRRVPCGRPAESPLPCVSWAQPALMWCGARTAFASFRLPLALCLHPPL